ncbi:MAG: adenylate/guanylate cyclase domain-containing protein, partial [Leptospiraceae bacterium]|nr:adenylate/guanylate cyclase domain-containing protein [Leptospiraceae bacterium]
DARNAVKCGLDMQNALLILNSDWKDRGIEIEIGIGIHTGEVLAGNIGNAEHAEYTVIGDAVNTASRIESLCKKMERNFIISEEVYNELDGTQNIEKLPRVLVKGKSEPLSVYAVKNL